MTPDEIERILELNSGKGLYSIYQAIATSHNTGATGERKHAERDAMAAVIQAVLIRQMQELDEAATKLTKVGIAIGIVGTVLAFIQVALALRFL